MAIKKNSAGKIVSSSSEQVAGIKAANKALLSNNIRTSLIGKTFKKIAPSTFAFILGGVVTGAGLYTLDQQGLLPSPSTFDVNKSFLADGNRVSIIATEKKNGISAHIVQNQDDASDRVTIFTTRNGDIITGNVLDQKGEPLFASFIKQYITDPAEQIQAQQQEQNNHQMTHQPEQMAYGQMIGEYQGEVPEVIKFVESLGGFKEDPSVSAENTLYVVYDPRCPYCHKFFDDSRSFDLKSKGLTIKWIPTLALGAARDGSNDEVLAVAGLTLDPTKDAKAFAATFDGHASDIIVTENHRINLAENLQFLIDIAESQGLPSAVPTAVFLDKKSGRARVLVSPGDAENLKIMFGE